jgi:hypothetical protein
MQYITHFQIDGRHSTRHHISRTPEPQQQGLLAPNHPKFLAEHEKSLPSLPTEIPWNSSPPGVENCHPIPSPAKDPMVPHGSPWFPMVPRMVSIKGSNLVAQVYHVVPCCTIAPCYQNWSQRRQRGLVHGLCLCLSVPVRVSEDAARNPATYINIPHLYMAMDQYLYIPFFRGMNIHKSQLFW